MKKSFPIIPIFIPHAGCPNACIFCNQRRISGHFAPPDADSLRQTLESSLPKAGDQPQIAFYGGSFTAIDENLQEMYLNIAGEYIKAGRAGSIRISTRPDCVNERSAVFLREHFVTVVELGAQSMDDSVLTLSKRGHTAEHTVRASGIIKAAGLQLGLQMMTGLPGSCPRTEIETAEKLAALSPDMVRIYPVVVLRDTELYDQWASGAYNPPGIAEAAETCADLLDLFEQRHIRVIRVGLNAEEGLSQGGAVAGAYHPAFGEIVRSVQYFRLAKQRIKEAGLSGQNINIFVHPSCVSKMTGLKKANIERLKRETGCPFVHVCADAGLAPGQVDAARETDEDRLAAAVREPRKTVAKRCDQ